MINTSIISNMDIKELKDTTYIPVITPSKWKYLSFDLEYSANLKQRTNDVKCSISQLYEIHPLLRLIFDSLEKSNKDYKDGGLYKIPAKMLVNVIFKKEKSDSAEKRNNERRYLNSILKKINSIKFLDASEEKLISFRNFKGDAYIYFLISSKFSDYVTNVLNKKNTERLKVTSSVRKYLKKLRGKDRAYAVFIERLYIQSRIELGSYYDDDCLIRYKERITQFFFKKNKKHNFSYKEIEKDAKEILEKIGINEKCICDLARSILDEKDQTGKSLRDKYNIAKKENSKPEYFMREYRQ